jgi:hypothetical protein
VSYIKVDGEEFAEWRKGPMAERFFKAVSKWAEDAKEAWVSESWDGGVIDPVRHAALKERYLALKQLNEVTAIDVEERLNEQSSSQ